MKILRIDYGEYGEQISNSAGATANVCGAFGYLSPQHVELVRLNFIKPNNDATPS